MKSLIYFFIFLSFVSISILPVYAEENKSVEDVSKLKRNTESISASIGTIFSSSPILGVNYLRLDFDLNEKFTIGTSYGMGGGNYTTGMTTYMLSGNIQTVSAHGKYYFFGAEVNNFFTETTVTGFFNFKTPFDGNIMIDSWNKRPIEDFDRSYGAISQLLGYEFSLSHFKLAIKGGVAGIGSKSTSGSSPFLVEIGAILDLSLGFIF